MDIKKRRELLGITQNEIANKLRVSRATVAMWESGEDYPNKAKLSGLASMLRCSMTELLKDEINLIGANIRICKSCQYENVVIANFCENCGTKLGEICFCWIKKEPYQCSFMECPGYELNLKESKL